MAPGTFGTLVAVPIWFGLSRLSSPLWLLTVAGAGAAAIVLAHRAVSLHGEEDAPAIVIDEIAGFLVTTALLPFDWKAALIAFLAFRACDVIKPWPCRAIDRSVGGGLGVVGDDLVAGLYAAALTRAALAFL